MSRRRLIFTALLGLVPVLWLAGVLFYRITGFASGAPASISTPPAALATAADYLAQGDYDYDRGDYEKAIADYGRAIELNPRFAAAYNSRAYTYMKVEQYALALPDLDEAIRLRPDYVNALMNRGDMYNYYYRVDRDRAMSDYDMVMAIDPHTANLCGHRLLALHNGWSPGVIVDLVTQGAAGA